MLYNNTEMILNLRLTCKKWREISERIQVVYKLYLFKIGKITQKINWIKFGLEEKLKSLNSNPSEEFGTNGLARFITTDTIEKLIIASDELNQKISEKFKFKVIGDAIHSKNNQIYGLCLNFMRSLDSYLSIYDKFEYIWNSFRQEGSRFAMYFVFKRYLKQIDEISAFKELVFDEKV